MGTIQHKFYAVFVCSWYWKIHFVDEIEHDQMLYTYWHWSYKMLISYKDVNHCSLSLASTEFEDVSSIKIRSFADKTEQSKINF